MLDIKDPVAKSPVKRNVFKTFPWQVIDKSNKTSHPLWFRTYEDLKAFYISHPFMHKDPTDLRILKMDENGKEEQRFAFEI